MNDRYQGRLQLALQPILNEGDHYFVNCNANIVGYYKTVPKRVRPLDACHLCAAVPPLSPYWGRTSKK